MPPILDSTKSLLPLRLALFAFLSLAAFPALAASWIAGTGYWQDTANWQGGVLPNASTTAAIGEFPPLFITMPTAVVTGSTHAAAFQLSLGTSPGKNGALIVQLGGVLNAPSGVYTGFVQSRGELHVYEGGTVTAERLYANGNASGVSIIEADGAGASITATNATSFFMGTSTLTVSNGGRYSTNFFEGDNYQTSGTASVTVTGNGAARGVVATNYFDMGGVGPSHPYEFTLTLDGGVFEALGNQTEIFKSFSASQAILGPGGGFFDTAGKSIGTNVALQGAGGLTKRGLGTLTLTGASTYAGDTQVAAGTLSVTQPYLANGADVRLATGGVLNLNTAAAVDAIRSLYIDGVLQPAGLYGAIGSGAQFTTSLITGTGFLQVQQPVIIPGDFDHDGTVDADDLTVWKTAFGATANADADHDNDSDGADFLVWQRHFGETASAAAVSTAVPEPAAAALLAIAFAGTFSRLLRLFAATKRVHVSGTSIPSNASSTPAGSSALVVA